MVQSITHGIRVSVKTNFEGTLYNNHKMNYAFKYIVTIENQSKDVVQLITRHWQIKDSLNSIEEVHGEGVIGQKPILKPGEKHLYSSGCLLSSPYGSMKGHYKLVNYTTTKKFKVNIPAFKLSAPFALN